MLIAYSASLVVDVPNALAPGFYYVFILSCPNGLVLPVSLAGDCSVSDHFCAPFDEFFNQSFTLQANITLLSEGDKQLSSDQAAIPSYQRGILVLVLALLGVWIAHVLFYYKVRFICLSDELSIHQLCWFAVLQSSCCAAGSAGVRQAGGPVFGLLVSARHIRDRFVD